VSPHRATPAVNTKFFPDGRVRRFPGNTIVCAVDPASPLHRACERVQERCRREVFREVFAYLPPASLHMTVFDLLCDQVRVEACWSRAIALDAPLECTDELLAKMLEQVVWPAAPRMRVTDLGQLGGDHTLHLRLEPADETTAESLRTFREEVSRATGIRHPGHETYFFHVSLAYPLRELGEAEGGAYRRFEAEMNERLSRSLGAVELGRPHLARFEDMFGFVSLPVTAPPCR
jgi:hypothetical protein